MLRVHRAARVQRYKIEIQVGLITQNLGYNIKYSHTRHPEIQQEIQNSKIIVRGEAAPSEMTY